MSNPKHTQMKALLEEMVGSLSQKDQINALTQSLLKTIVETAMDLSKTWNYHIRRHGILQRSKWFYINHL